MISLPQKGELMALKLESLQSEISKKGFSWSAEKTAISELSKTEQAELLGLNVTEEELAATEKAISAVNAMESTFSALTESISAPSAIDWRNNGGDYTTSIKNQANCGSCVSFATLATIESRMNIACKNPNLDPDYSEAFLFYCGCGNCCGTGWNFPPALNFCQNTGVAKDSDFPYTPANQSCKSGVTPQFKISSWSSVMSMADRKNVIATKGPVVAGMAVYQDFYAYRSGVYRHTTGNLSGYHAVSVVGYDDSLQCWIAKNSWGTGWGDNGWFKIAYGDSGIDTSFPFYDVNLTCAAPPTNCQQYVPYLKQILVLAQQNAGLRRCLRYYVCGKPPLPFNCLPQYIAIATAVRKVLAICPQYRQPFCNIIG
jgi:C1A family cysteine protease